MTRNHSTEKRRWLLLGLATLAAAFPSLINTKTIYATDDNTVSIAVDQNAALKPSGNLYKATTNVTVKTGKPYGFNLTMQADTADLINSKDRTHKISATPSITPIVLNANQWGYSLSKSATTFSAVPAATKPGATATTPAVIADVTKAKPAGCTNPANCTKQVTFAANVDPAKLASGSYSTAITYTATAKPKPKPVDWLQRTAKANPSEVCRSGDNSSSCLVYLDKNMIPVIYTGDENHAQWTSIKWPENPHDPGAWYNYNQKKWANAITVKDPSKYKGKRMVVDQSDILGFWVYVPRYRYKVLRYSSSDPAVSAQNFTIEFENKQSTKAIPTANGTWATHPAFTFGSKELNGIWFGKFETTGDVSSPTVLPNEARYYDVSSSIGHMYTIAKTLGVADNNNIGGKTDYTILVQNSHHLAKLNSHMVNNNDWGAATYLSASKYGAGYNGVQINSQSDSHNNGNGDTYGTTGCGPQANGNTDSYNDGGTLGTQSACSSSDPQRAYNGALGQLASTTNNSTGIYDMAGGGDEYVAASYSDNLNNSDINYAFGSNAAHPPYVNTYNFKDFNSCTYQTCGGQALYETKSWNSADFVSAPYPWFRRGGCFYSGSGAGIFYVDDDYGNSIYHYYAFRVALIPVL